MIRSRDTSRVMLRIIRESLVLYLSYEALDATVQIEHAKVGRRESLVISGVDHGTFAWCGAEDEECGLRMAESLGTHSTIVSATTTRWCNLAGAERQVQ